MARPSLLSLLSVLILFHGTFSLARTTQFQFQNECQLNRLDSVRPSHRAQHEAGLTEFWDPNHEQFQCAGVALMRNTIQPQGLLLPQFSNAPQLMYIEQGRGYTGIVMPGCAETFQDPQQGATRGRRASAGESPSRDQHQKLRRFRQGDIIAIPAGVVHWCYNDGDEPVVAVALVDTSNHQNQLDRNPRKFHLAGNPEEEMRQMRRMQEEGTRLRQGEGREQEGYQPGAGGRGSQSRCNNLFCGFDTEILAEALNIDRQTARRLQGENDGRGSIIRVRERLEFVRPPTMEEEEQERGGRRYELAAETENGLEETFCSMKLRENIERPERADIYNPNAGRISTINSHTLPILRFLRLSAERVVLYQNAGVVPNWCMNAHKVLYMIRGRCRMQVVNEAGQQVFNGDVQKGQILVIPVNHAVVKRAQNEGAEWITFNTNDNAMTNTLSGRTSALKAMPEDVLANAFRISRDEARRLKFANEDTYFSSGSRSPMRAEA